MNLSRETWMMVLGGCAAITLCMVSPFFRFPRFIARMLDFTSDSGSFTTVWLGLAALFVVVTIRVFRRTISDLNFALVMAGIVVFVVLALVVKTGVGW